MQARLIRLFEMVEHLGLERIREPHAKHLRGKLWELRAKSPEGIARGIYVALAGQRVIILHVFAKKSQKTPAGALTTAEQRLKQVMR
ncbi:Phage derived protein Gp49-like [Mesorhizobium australicum]|uniref:Phage derived protein Gp49-like n=1 Tax=Mesorhizobium australicum TaxID=536018 RepID=A0A1X7PZM9_9HYPH|nr:Phage derived protein Gp49-like [Mesorhizobium australicum]